MILSLSQEHIEDIIKAVQDCVILEYDNKQEILKPLEGQLKTQIEEENKQLWQEYDEHKNLP